MSGIFSFLPCLQSHSRLASLQAVFGLMATVSLVSAQGNTPPPAVTPLAEQIAQDKPAAWWRFESPLAETSIKGQVHLTEGPDDKLSSTLPTTNQALQLAGDGSRLEFPSTEELRFDQGDAITIEAWVRLDEMKAGSSGYIVSKGRSTSKQENQNWALRLTSGNGAGKLGFLFRSRPDGDHPGAYHRWTSDASVAADGKWHHVALVYQFGDPTSLRAYIDGRQRGGRWDMAGATEQAPVVDDDIIVIGSSRGGAPANSLKGAVDEIAIYRRALPHQNILSRYQRVRRSALPPQLTSVDQGKVLIEVREGQGERDVWPDLDTPATEIFGIDSFALNSLPHVYNERAARRDRALPLHVRLAAEVTLPPGKHTLLFRSPGLSRVSADGATLLEQKSFSVSGSAHGHPREMPATDPGYPRLRMGTQETTVALHSSGAAQLIVAEGMVGLPGRRFSMGELLLAVQLEGTSEWKLLATDTARSPRFDDLSFANYNQAQSQLFQAIERERRKSAYEALAPDIARRHEYARQHIASLPPLTLPAGLTETATVSEIVDAFLLAKIDQASQVSDPENTTDDPRHAQVISILEANCFRCHGEKSSGGLKLNSRTAALDTGKSGLHAVVPGDPDESELFYRLITKDPDEIMPPESQGLSAEEIELTKKWIADGAPWPARHTSIDLTGVTEPLTFLKRLYLNTIGVLPSPEESQRFLAAPEATRVAEEVDRLLADPRHADHWVSYWQDALAENPRLVKPVLNNTGPFRYWIHEALLDNKPMDQFAADLVTFQGSMHGGGAGGFARAAENDVPMAAKAHVLGNAFLGVEMKCARCHDSPYHSTKQEDLFSLAAMLGGKPITLPNSSTVPAEFFQREGKSNSVVKVTLLPGSTVDPDWPFPDLVNPSEGQVDVAWEITRPENHRFAEVIVNRAWQRYFGQGFVEPVHDWEGNTASHPELLEYLSREFVKTGYDMRALSRIILNTEAFRRHARVQKANSPQERYFEGPLQRRFSAEQIVDSLFTASGVPNYSEELTFDIEGVFGAQDFLNMGFPQRAWQMVSTASDRDRPSLTLPNADSILAVMSAYGWRDERPEPVSERETEPNLLQPGMLGNGIMGMWVTRLSDYSELTGAALRAATPEALVDDLFLRYLTRFPTESEREGFVSLLAPGFDTRAKINPDEFKTTTYVPDVREVSWTNHLSVGANEIATRAETRAFQGPPPTKHLDTEWRERMEDAVWALINSPELAFVP